MKKATFAAMRRHAEEVYPAECVGFVVSHSDGREIYVRGQNVADAPDAGFVTRPDDWAAAEDMGAVVAFVHSHPDNTASPSEADLVACEAMAERVGAMPWYIVEVRKDIGQEAPQALAIEAFSPSGYRAPLLGRTFHHGVLDCYSVIRDFHAREMGISIPDFHRADGWWEGDEEVYLDNFAAAGFRPLAVGETVQRGDVILMNHLAKRTNHGAVYLGDGRLSERPDLFPMQGTMLHHLYGRLSTREVYGGYWQEITRLVLRHREASNG
ncbi:C40 family peptidase [Achromobacter animicus]|uniref:C40 family peptidase n=1 Tax=Achromobacter animicus TaxID=1389935 RepID=UPI0028AFA259|nr:C40 family peptidase [Achromobacter animicus]